MHFPNIDNVEKLSRWNDAPKGVDINLLVPKKFVNEYRSKGIDAHSFSIRTSELSPFHWCQLFNVKYTDPFGIVLTRAVLKMQSESNRFSIQELLECVKRDKRSNDAVCGVAENFLTMAAQRELNFLKNLSLRCLRHPDTTSKSLASNFLIKFGISTGSFCPSPSKVTMISPRA